MDQLPKPPVPAGVDLRDFQFMPIDVRRLLTSETWMLGDGEERAAAMTLWLESWHQVPAGSLPSNDRMLAHLAQCPRWSKVKSHALRGWDAHSDGRLYHPVVCEKVLEAWISKLAERLGAAEGNAKRWGSELDPLPYLMAIKMAADGLKALNPHSKALGKKLLIRIQNLSPPESPPESPPDSPSDRGARNPQGREHRKGQGQGQGQGQGHTYENGTPQSPPESPPESGDGVDPSRPPAGDFAAFQRVKAAYPEFSGDQSDWLLAERECQRRVEEGATWLELEAGAVRFARFVEAGGRSGPGYVNLPSKFFGSAKWREEWKPPPSKAQQHQDANVSASLEWLAQEEAKDATN